MFLRLHERNKQPSWFTRLCEKLMVSWILLPMFIFLPAGLTQFGHWLGPVLWGVLALWVALPLSRVVYMMARNNTARRTAERAPESRPVSGAGAGLAPPRRHLKDDDMMVP